MESCQWDTNRLPHTWPAAVITCYITTYEFPAGWHRWCFERGVPDRSGDVPSQPFIMKHSSDTSRDEPVGIVISGGHSLAESTPRFSAYIWAPAPDEEISEEVQAA
jgi:GMP synthase-like glutamine amidotransferase